jgi:hypothetical protein
MTVPDNTVSSISKPEALHLGKKRLGFQLDSLRSNCRAPDRRILVRGSSISSG